MSRNSIFTAGSLAKSYVDVADWYGARTESVNAKRICVPFSGFGRLASAMCQTDTEMYVCDYQHLHTAIIRGVYAAHEWRSNVDKPRFHKGLAYEGKCIRNMDERSAGFVDWIVKNGTDLDVAAVGMALPSQTMRGWLSTWTGNFDGLWAKFNKIRDDFIPFIRMPGSWCWVEDDIFRTIAAEDRPIPDHLDVLAIDPPRLGTGVGGKDAYSTGAWQKLNVVLGGKVKIAPWTTRNFFSNLDKLFTYVKSDYVVFSWQDGNPDTEDVKRTVLQYGTLLDEEEWESRGKIIHGWWIKR